MLRQAGVAGKIIDGLIGEKMEDQEAGLKMASVRQGMAMRMGF